MKLKLEDKRSDIIAARDAWKSDFDSRKAKYDSQEAEYNKAQYVIAKEIEELVKQELGNTPLALEFDIRPYGSLDVKTYMVRITANEYQKFDDDRALSWNWGCELDNDGNVIKESGSWSGLQATTKEQLDDLRETLRVLDILNNMDWKAILDDANVRRPKRSDYFTMDDPRREKTPDFGKQLKMASIEDAIGQDILIKGKPIKLGSRGKSYYLIHKQTPKQTSVTEISAYHIQKAQEEGRDVKDSLGYGTDYRITTDTFLNAIPEDPEIIDLR
ncbi:MAG: hypothetical protein J6V44_15350 [Methanobrevibacter sp.]|nr:hypothetical protein [Methanobrevibacter sp.]MBO7694590.1 hypothetical protein [Methanobrevibacter sp.]